jgi:hypothetical protein
MYGGGAIYAISLASGCMTIANGRGGGAARTVRGRRSRLISPEITAVAMSPIREPMVGSRDRRRAFPLAVFHVSGCFGVVADASGF